MHVIINTVFLSRHLSHTLFPPLSYNTPLSSILCITSDTIVRHNVHSEQKIEKTNCLLSIFSVSIAVVVVVSCFACRFVFYFDSFSPSPLLSLRNVNSLLLTSLICWVCSSEWENYLSDQSPNYSLSLSLFLSHTHTAFACLSNILLLSCYSFLSYSFTVINSALLSSDHWLVTYSLTLTYTHTM